MRPCYGVAALSRRCRFSAGQLLLQPEPLQQRYHNMAGNASQHHLLPDILATVAAGQCSACGFFPVQEGGKGSRQQLWVWLTCMRCTMMDASGHSMLASGHIPCAALGQVIA